MQVVIDSHFQYTFLDYPDNHSSAVTIFFYGCEHFCENCHNPKYADRFPQSSVIINLSEFHKLTKRLIQKHRADKIVLSGGDPLFPKNRDLVSKFLLETDLDVCIYTGYDIEEVKRMGIKGFEYIKCGKYQEIEKQKSYKSDELMFLASKNQALYDSEYRLLSKDGCIKFNQGEIKC